jgi:hypothetical protein
LQSSPSTGLIRLPPDGNDERSLAGTDADALSVHSTLEPQGRQTKWSAGRARSVLHRQPQHIVIGIALPGRPLYDGTEHEPEDVTDATPADGPLLVRLARDDIAGRRFVHPTVRPRLPPRCKTRSTSTQCRTPHAEHGRLLQRLVRDEREPHQVEALQVKAHTLDRDREPEHGRHAPHLRALRVGAGCVLPQDGAEHEPEDVTDATPIDDPLLVRLARGDVAGGHFVHPAVPPRGVESLRCRLAPSVRLRREGGGRRRACGATSATGRAARAQAGRARARQRWHRGGYDRGQPRLGRRVLRGPLAFPRTEANESSTHAAKVQNEVNFGVASYAAPRTRSMGGSRDDSSATSGSRSNSKRSKSMSTRLTATASFSAAVTLPAAAPPKWAQSAYRPRSPRSHSGSTHFSLLHSEQHSGPLT